MAETNVSVETRFWKRPNAKRLRRILCFVVVVAPAIYFAPVAMLILLLCGVIDVGRHRNITYELIEKYFMGNGIGTWMLSPLNLVADLLSLANPGVHKLEDMPAEHRREIEACVHEFVANGDRIKAHMAERLKQSRRGMLTFKWLNVRQDTELQIPAFERDYRYIQTIAVSAFNTRESTMRHFGPLRLTFRVLYNLEPANSREVFIEVDGRPHYWIDNPLFIFDDTMFHRSVNNVDGVRYCLFMDIVRPNYSSAAFNLALNLLSVVGGSFKRFFYQNWSFMR
jgi:aspartyl/asparaginyl beta-hydroxylase (cupin superfamily)